MTEAQWDTLEEDDISIFAVGTLLLRNRWRIMRWAFAGALVALAMVWNRHAFYVGSASFIPQGADAGRSGLANLAGQLGVSIPTGGQGLTPDFYVRLVKSRELLTTLALDTVKVPEMGGKRVAVEDLLGLKPGAEKPREEDAIAELSRRIGASTSKTTAVVDITVSMEWPSVALALTQKLLDGVNEFNQRTRRDQAAAERKFIEGRLAVATSELRAAEDRLQQFLEGNRQAASPDLQLNRDRIQRDVTFRQQVVATLTQAYEDVRMREVRDVPVISIVDQPAVPAKPQARGRGIRTLAGFAIGAALGILLVLASDQMAKRRAEGDPAALEFEANVEQLKRKLPWRRRAAAKSADR